jgi:Tfp pilus assembly protein PilO
MKIRPSKWILLILLVVVIGAIWAGMVLTQQASQQQELKRNLLLVQQKTAQIKLDDLTSKNELLITEKTQYTGQIIETETRLSTSFDDISATDAILESAHAHNLTIFELTSSGESNGSMVGNKFVVLPLNYHVKGKLADMADFVSNIKNLFPTGVVQSYEFTIGGDTPAESTEIILIPTQSSQMETDATIKIIIYDYQG